MGRRYTFPLLCRSAQQRMIILAKATCGGDFSRDQRLTDSVYADPAVWIAPKVR
jgi:hypothetical protein